MTHEERIEAVAAAMYEQAGSQLSPFGANRWAELYNVEVRETWREAARKAIAASGLQEELDELKATMPREMLAKDVPSGWQWWESSSGGQWQSVGKSIGPRDYVYLVRPKPEPEKLYRFYWYGTPQEWTVAEVKSAVKADNGAGDWNGVHVHPIDPETGLAGAELTQDELRELLGS